MDIVRDELGPWSIDKLSHFDEESTLAPLPLAVRQRKEAIWLHH